MPQQFRRKPDNFSLFQISTTNQWYNCFGSPFSLTIIKHDLFDFLGPWSWAGTHNRQILLSMMCFYHFLHCFLESCPNWSCQSSQLKEWLEKPKWYIFPSVLFIQPISTSKEKGASCCFHLSFGGFASS